MKIAFFELKKWEQDYIKEKLKGHKLIFYERKLSKRDLQNIKDVNVLAVFIYSELKKDILEKLPKLKLTTTMSTGYDHIDLETCKKRNIRVCNVPYYGENTVAEHTFGLILSLSKKLPQAIERTKQDDFTLKGLMGFDLKGKTLGVIGPGHIGQHVIKIAKGFDMKVIAYGRHPDKKLAKKLGFKYVSFNYLLKNSDIITIHVPLTKGTYHMINMDNIKLIKKGAYIVNTARGPIIDTTALIYGLDHGILAGAALDVLEGECDIQEERQLLHKDFLKKCDWQTLIENHVLLKEKNVIVTPHSAFYTKEALQRILDTTVKNIKSFMKGRVMNKVI
jgi:D-lactate dehydrogenase